MMLAKSLQSAAGNAAGAANYIEDVFSTYLYKGGSLIGTVPSATVDPYSQEYGWFTRTAGVETSPTNNVRQLVIRYAGQTIYDGSVVSSFNYDGFDIVGGQYVSSSYGWSGDYCNVFALADASGAKTITNGIDLAGEGGLVWIKDRISAFGHRLFDTNRGVLKHLATDSTNAEGTLTGGLSAFNADGFSIGNNGSINTSSNTYASWTFRKQPKFFDVVTWNGNSVSGRQIPHSLGSVPGCILVKVTSVSGSWFVWHRSMGGNNFYMTLNSPDPRTNGGAPYWNNTGPTDTVFTVGNDSDINQTGRTYVAYLFAHDAGGFGLSGEDNVISCGSMTIDGSGNATVNLGYEPQWVMLKRTDGGAESWLMLDVMRGWAYNGTAYLLANLSNAEGNYGSTDIGTPTATGFSAHYFTAGATYIYIAIRRGPMKVPESGTSVFGIDTADGSVDGFLYNAGFPIDFALEKGTVDTFDWKAGTRLTSGTRLETNTTDAEATSASVVFDSMTSWQEGIVVNSNYYSWMFRRAPGFMDVCCYTGTGVARTVAHNLGVAPELMIIKSRSTGYGWTVYAAGVGNTSFAYLNEPDGFQVNSTAWNNTSPTNSVFTVGTGPIINASGSTFVAYLFASCPGVSKCGSYTGTGTTQQINCGFTSGARFVLIKKTSGTGSWYVWDSARGIVSGNDPYLLLNSTAAEVTSTDYVDTYSAGFEISSTAPSEINENGGSFIFFAVA